MRFTYIVVAFSATSTMAGEARSVDYEAPPVVRADELLPKNLLQSGDHRVRDDVATIGNSYWFHIESDLGNFQVTSYTMLRIRVQEIMTVAQAMSRFDATNRELSDELRSELSVRADSAVDIVASPASTALDLAGQITTNLGDTFAGADGLTVEERSYHVTTTEGFVYAAHKRNIANQLDLDVYSSNPSVQKFLNVIATARTAGNFTAGVSTVALPQDDEVTVADGIVDAEAKESLRRLTPADLDEYNDRMLAAMEISPELRRKFLRHANYSPTHKTYIVAYLGALSGVTNRAALIESARGAKSEEGALYYEQMARILAVYHERVGKIRELRSGPQVPVAITADGQALFVVPVDIIYWNRGAESLFAAFIGHAGIAGYMEPELIVTGTVTARAKAELEQRGFTLREKFLTVH
ncbi:MAG: hypothetical protein L0Y67_02835 [Gammaproteobacteria bacterium]|nr:hypothetical protein [Gammaproteobacteria bacterium]MCI0590531.1 hypothetical protein [Gammaproteobacteria bacterium]